MAVILSSVRLCFGKLFFLKKLGGGVFIKLCLKKMQHPLFCEVGDFFIENRFFFKKLEGG